jgi:hypothetical protein
LHVRVARGHLALNLDRAANRIDHARKLAEQTVARRVEDAAAVLLDLGVGSVARQQSGLGTSDPGVAFCTGGWLGLLRRL